MAGGPRDLMHSHGTLQFFAYDHLPDNLREVSKLFGDLAEKLEEMLPHNSQKWSCMERLLEAKDCAVRAKLFK